MNLDRIREELSDDHLKAIGLVAAAWSRLELTLQHAVWMAAKLDSVALGPAITSHLTVRSLLDIWETAVTHLGHTAQWQQLKDLRGRVESLQTLRNQIIHGLWRLQTSGETAIIRQVARGMVTTNATPFPLAQINETAEQIGALIDDIYAFISEHVMYESPTAQSEDGS